MYPSSTDSFSHLTSSIHAHGYSHQPNYNIFSQTDLVQGFFFTSNGVNPNPPENTLSKKKTSVSTCKKDRHSKIYTAHGPRDRRVRLSMDIARKFFDLQDMLGFDKASNTLDWLLNSSKESIKELVNMKMKLNSSNGSGCLFEMVYNTNNNNEKMMRNAFNLSSRESRAKARERARDRTREKMKAKSIRSLIKGQDLITSSSKSPNSESCSRSWLQIDHHIPDIWDITTPPEVEYNGKYWDAKYNNYTIRED